MSHRRITSMIAALLTTGLLLVAPAFVQSASAAPTDPVPADTTACAQPTDGYAPRGACQLLVQQAQSACIGGAPVLQYAVEPEGTPNTTVTITWQNPTGADVVDAGLPLSGSVLWPGTVVEDGAVVDWPGWTRQPDGSFTEGDEYDWVRPSVTLLFEVNPSATEVVVYPPESASCSDPQLILGASGGVDAALPATPVIDRPAYRSGVLAAGDSTAVREVTQAAHRVAFRSGVLAATGVDPSPELRAAGLLLGAGVLTLVAVRLLGRRRVRAED
jgi:hypothetical protein